MPNYTDAELFSESAKLFRAQVEPVKEAGVLNTSQEYAQLLEMAGITFLMYPDSIFYVAFLVRNRLISLAKAEVDLLEDMLVLLDELGQQGTPVSDTSSLSNAKTAILALDAAQSLKNRPELSRFDKYIDRFSENYRKNVVSASGVLSRPKEDARNLLKDNLERLKEVHQSLLNSLYNLRDLLTSFESLDLPSAVSKTTLSSIQQGLDEIDQIIKESSSTDNIASSRYVLLKSLSSKVAVSLLSGFKNPEEVKIRTPNNPIPAELKHYGRVTGDGEIPYVDSSPGPWEIGFDLDHIVLNFKSGSFTVPLSGVGGSTLPARIDGPFSISSGVNDRIHMTVDPAQYSSSATLSSLDTAVFSNRLPLRFKHLGSPISFNTPNSMRPEDYNGRSIVELETLQSLTISSYSPTSKLLTATGFSLVGDLGSLGFRQDHIGNYIKYGTSRVEILDVLSSTQALVEVVPGVVNPSGAATLHGYSTSSSSNQAKFYPALSDMVVGLSAKIGPTTKTARFTSGVRTASELVSDIESLQGDYDINVPYAALSFHVKAFPSPGNANKISFSPRSWSNPTISVSNVFSKSAGSYDVVWSSSHETLGMRIGEFSSYRVLQPEDLVGLLNAHPSFSNYASAAVIVSEIASGSSMQSTTWSSTLSDSSADFSSVKVGDQVEITSGVNALGSYSIDTVGTTSLTVRRKLFVGNESGLRYRIFRKVVRIQTLTAQRGDFVEVVEAPTTLDFVSGPVYAAIPYFEAVDKLGSLLVFSNVVPGDLLKITSYPNSVSISSVDGSRLTLESGLPSNIEKASFSILGYYSNSYEILRGKLTTLLSSKSLLGMYGFNKNLNELDYAITSAILPGQSFLSTRNQAKNISALLLSIISEEIKREDEYTTSVPTASLTVTGSLNPYVVSSIDPVDKMIDAFLDRRYERAVDLLLSGYLRDFFSTNEETGSYSGSILHYSRIVSGDLPGVPSEGAIVRDEIDSASGFNYTTDPDLDFSDTDGQDLAET
jgi:hypothetical protein